MSRKEMNYFLSRILHDEKLCDAFAKAVTDVANRHDIAIDAKDVKEFIARQPREH